jgi:hypothetical protein
MNVALVAGTVPLPALMVRGILIGQNQIMAAS